MLLSDSGEILKKKWIELGSEFDISLNDLTERNNNILNYFAGKNVKWYNYGRTAIKQIPILNNKRVLLPEFICDSVIKCFDIKQIIFYKIDRNFEINLIDLIEKIDYTVGYIYIAHYFGYLQSDIAMNEIKKIASQKNIIIIEDITQSMFSKHEFWGDYIVSSIRKWMAVHQGGMLIFNNNMLYKKEKKLPISADNYRVYAMILKNMFLDRKYNTNVKYREIFIESEHDIDFKLKEEKISDLAFFLLKCVDIEQLIIKRKRNFVFLQDRLMNIGLMPVRVFKENECPLVYPIRVKNRDDFRRYLIENKIYCAVHWPYTECLGIDRKIARENADTLISLPIDQRYDKNDIEYMVKVIQEYGGELLF